MRTTHTMGVSSSASVFIGFEVYHQDFWTEVSFNSQGPECPNGHPGPDGKFCQDCGGKIEIQRRESINPTPNFHKYVSEYGKTAGYQPDCVEVFDPDPDAYLEEKYDRSAFGGLQLECVDPVDGSDHEKDHMAFGKSVLGVSDICGSGGGKPSMLGLDELQKHFAEVEKIRDALGLDRPVKLYLTAYCSY